MLKEHEGVYLAWPGIKRVVMSLWFQCTTGVLIFLHLLVKPDETTLDFFQHRRSQDRDRGLGELAKIFALATVVAFFIVTCVRVFIHLRGKLDFFSSLWNVVDITFFLICSGIEVADFALALGLPLVDTLCLISSLCIVNSVFGSKHSYSSELDSQIRQLQRECDKLENVNRRLREELDEIEKRIASIELEYRAITEQAIETTANGFFISATFEW